MLTYDLFGTGGGGVCLPQRVGGGGPAFSLSSQRKRKVGVALFSLAPAFVHIAAENRLSW